MRLLHPQGDFKTTNSPIEELQKYLKRKEKQKRKGKKREANLFSLTDDTDVQCTSFHVCTFRFSLLVPVEYFYQLYVKEQFSSSPAILLHP